MKHTKTVRAGALLVGAAMALTLALPAFANTGHQSGWNIGWNDSDFRGSSSECEGAKLGDSEVLWHFVQTSVPAGVASGSLTATFTTAGTVTVDSYKKAGAVLHWQIITGKDTLLTFSSDVTSDGNLNLSHICVGSTEEESQSPSSSPSQKPSEKPSEKPSDKPSEKPSDKPSENPSDKPSEKPSESPTGSPETSTQQPTQKPSEKPSIEPETQAPSTAPSDKPSVKPTSEVKGATGTPETTLPPTDAIGSSDNGNGGNGAWILIVAGLTALSVSLVLRKPATRTNR